MAFHGHREDVFREEWKKVKDRETDRQTETTATTTTWSGADMANQTAGHTFSLRVKHFLHFGMIYCNGNTVVLCSTCLAIVWKCN